MIHAATMVTAGVYLVARMFPLFYAAPHALQIVAIIGAFTALFAATMGLTAFDIKRVLAFSTVSQLGFMMAGLGAGAAVGVMAVGVAIFHLIGPALPMCRLRYSCGKYQRYAGDGRHREVHEVDHVYNGNRGPISGRIPILYRILLQRRDNSNRV
jgi:NADH-quinone oxidoreductase subunit L